MKISVDNFAENAHNSALQSQKKKTVMSFRAKVAFVLIHKAAFFISSQVPSTEPLHRLVRLHSCGRKPARQWSAWRKNRMDCRGCRIWTSTADPDTLRTFRARPTASGVPTG
jgi:hypothetical protein